MRLLLIVLSFLVVLIFSLLLLLLLIHVVNTLRYKVYSTRVLYAPIKKAPFLNAYRLADPYRAPGVYRRAQLHLHTSNSSDVKTKIPVAKTVEKYRKSGYSFLALTDHDRITYYNEAHSPDSRLILGMEKTLPFLLRPLGRHLVIIGVKAEVIENADFQLREREALLLPAHPNWEGNLGTGRWYLKDLLALKNLKLIEISNRHSDTTADLALWHKLLAAKGYQDPVWGVAVDDSDNAVPINQGWIMIKTPDLTEESFFRSLRAGSFYSTTGPEADFRVEKGAIVAYSPKKALISFINNRNQTVARFQGKTALYRPMGDEGFIRVEVSVEGKGVAWSQPFFLLPVSTE